MNTKVLLGIIFAVALLVRFVGLTSYPVGLTLDEVSIGYNGYAIAETGADEWGQKFPLAFRSLSDYKPPVSIYLVSLSTAVFGLGEFAVRFPNALLGSLTVFAFWAMLKRIGFSNKVSIIGAAWVAINPWHVFYSRAGFEALIALFFVIVGIWLFLRSVEEKSFSSLILSIVLFCLSVWTYHAERVFVPALVLALSYLKRRELLSLFSKSVGKIAIAGGVILLFSVPLFYLTFLTPAVSTRALATSLFRDFRLPLHNGFYLNYSQFIFDNDLFLIARHVLGKYFNYMDVEFLFRNGLSLTPKSYPGMGLMYAVNLPVFAVGIYSLFFHKSRNLRIIALILFVLGPLPASLTLDEQHAIRSLTWLPFWGLAFAVGAEKFLSMKIHFKNVLVGIYASLLGINIVYFGDMYFRQFPYFYAELWLYGYKQAALIGCAEKENYDEVLITDTFGTEGPLYTGVPYEYVLFYCNIAPREFLANNRTIPGFVHRRPDWKKDSKQNMLIIAAPYDLPLDEINKDKVDYIRYPNGRVAFVVVRP